MYGGDTKPVTTINRDFNALLDVSRLISRVGNGPHTGVDRVELAYLEWCLATDATVYGLVRVSGGLGLLDRSGLVFVHERLVGNASWGKRDVRGMVGLKTARMRARAESDIRRMAVEFKRTGDFQTELPTDLIYLNTGHSNLSSDFLDMISSKVARVAIFVHDLIPIEFPQFQNPFAVKAFQKKIDAIKRYADVILVNSGDTKMKCQRVFSRKQQIVSSHLGIDVPQVHREVLSSVRPYFVTVGTIEPRKNHELLLDVWEKLPRGQRPHLHIVGRRGWENKTTFKRLDNLRPDHGVIEHNDMNDADLWSLLLGAKALLFPSHAEGFGLPSLEAAALGVPVICGDLAIHHELLGDYPVYVDSKDTYLWKKIILEQTQATTRTPRPTPHIPTWDEHFARVNQAITEKR